MADITTYVLAGYDKESAFADELAVYAKRSDVKIIRPQEGVSFKKALEEIKPPADIIIACHGGEHGTFQWKEHFSFHYDTLFKDMPQEGIGAVISTGCFGEMAQFGTHIPPGTLVMSLVGQKVPSWGGNDASGVRFAFETQGITDPVRLVLKSLDAVDIYQNGLEAATYNAKHKHDGVAHVDANLGHILPQVITIGGTPPLVIDMAKETDALLQHGPEGKINRTAFADAIRMVQDTFDAHGSRHAEHKLDKHIAYVAELMLEGKSPKNMLWDDVKIQRALAIAYLEKNGDLTRDIAHAKAPYPAPQAQPDPTPTAPTLPPLPLSPSPEEIRLQLLLKQFGVLGVPEQRLPSPSAAPDLLPIEARLEKPQSIRMEVVPCDHTEPLSPTYVAVHSTGPQKSSGHSMA